MAAPNAFDKEQFFGLAEMEMESRVDMFNKLNNTCFNKCVGKQYSASDLDLAEINCIDRCASKYWLVTKLIGQLLGNNQPPM